MEIVELERWRTNFTDEINFADYKILRNKLLVLLDKLAYPIAKLNYNHDETEWYDFGNKVSLSFADYFKEQDNADEIKQEQLLKDRKSVV